MSNAIPIFGLENPTLTGLSVCDLHTQLTHTIYYV